MAQQVVNKDGKKFNAWNWGINDSPDNSEELMFLINNKGLMLDPDCSWRAIIIDNETTKESGDCRATLLYNIVFEGKQIVDATDIKVVSRETFEAEYILIN